MAETARGFLLGDRVRLFEAFPLSKVQSERCQHVA
jgi:hypothetical protein